MFVGKILICTLRGLYGSRCPRKVFVATAGEVGVIAEIEQMLPDDYHIMSVTDEGLGQLPETEEIKQVQDTKTSMKFQCEQVNQKS